MEPGEIYNYLEYGVNIAPLVVMVASAIAAITPTKADNRALSWFKRFVGVLAINIGQAKPASQVIREQNQGRASIGGRGPALVQPPVAVPEPELSKRQARRNRKGGRH